MRPSNRLRLPLCIALLLIATSTARSDVIVVTQAMQAETILQVDINEDSVVAEFEIGEKDYGAFRPSMTAAIQEKLGELPETGVEDRETDWSFGKFLRVELEYVEPRDIEIKYGRRLVRDDVTGEPLTPQPEQSPQVIRVRLEYALPKDANQLMLSPPMKLNGQTVAVIGFEARHLGLKINEFRYLTDNERLFLDRRDPWYTVFGNPNLKRQYTAPLTAFLYVEYFEVRKEQVLRLRDLAELIKFEPATPGVVTIAEQEQLKQEVGEWLTDRCSVLIDGERVKPVLDRIHFIERTLGTTTIVDPPRDLDLNQAMLGVIFVYPIEGLPDKVEMKWDLFTNRVKQVPATATDEAGGLPSLLTDDDPTLTWINHLKSPSLPVVVELPAPEEAMLMIPAAWVLSGLWAASALVLCLLRKWKGATLCLICGVATGTLGSHLSAAGFEIDDPQHRLVPPSSETTHQVLSGLLENSYHAFDRRDEDLVYDRLARSISGDLLKEVYLQMRESIELELQGGARVKVETVELESAVGDHVDPASEFEYGCRWTVTGSVGHWGHQHTRKNQYEAMISIASVDGEWKMTELELIDSQRIDPDPIQP